MTKTAFLFPGQGAQSVGMGAEMAANLPEARRWYDRANEILGYDLAKLCFEGPAEELDSTIYSQPALFVTSLAAIEILRRDNPQAEFDCSAAAGLSLGEYTALVFAEVMTFDDALKVVQVRGTAMQEAADATPSGMVSILGLDRADVENLCVEARGNGILQVANLLCPGNIVVSGTNDACEKIAELAPAAGAMKAIPLAVAGAFHTPIMQPAVDRLAAALAAVPMSRPRIAVVSNVDGQPHEDPNEIRDLLIRQVVSPVRWEDSIRWMLDSGYKQYFEVGPGRVLRGLMRRIDRSVTCEGVIS